MTGQRRLHLLIGLIGLMGALSADAAVAALMFENPSFAPTDGDVLLETFAEELLASEETLEGAGLSGPGPLDSPAEEELPAIALRAWGMVPAGAAASNPSAQSGGGSTGEALTASVGYLPELDLQGSIPSEAVPILSSGPRFDLLRPS